MAKKPTEAELRKKEAEDKAFMRSYLDSHDSEKREAAMKAIFRTAEKYGCSPEEALAIINDEDAQSD